MLTPEQIESIRARLNIKPQVVNDRTRELDKAWGGDSRIERFRTEAEEAEKEAAIPTIKRFGKEFGKRIGEVSGVVPTGERIAAGIAPYVVPEEELPGVVEELVGGVVTPEPSKLKEFGQIALDLPLISLGLSKNISKILSQQVTKLSTPQIISLLDKPLVEFAPEALRTLLKKEVPVEEITEKVTKPITKALEARRLKRIEQAKSEVDEAVGKIVQGKPVDIPTATRALKNVDTEGIKTYSELNERVTEKIDTIAKQLDSFLDKQTGIYKRADLTQTTKVGTRTVKQNFVDDATTQLKELYTKIKDPEALAKIQNLEAKLAKEGLDVRELNDLAREYGRTFGRKAFSKIGDPLTSVNAQAFENTRKGIKATARGKIEGKISQTLDKQMSDLLDTRFLTNKMEIKVNALYQKVTKRGLFEKISRGLAGIVDIATFHTISGFTQRLLVKSNLGLKTMNSIDIENALAKNLKKLDKLLETGTDDEIIKGVLEIMK